MNIQRGFYMRLRCTARSTMAPGYGLEQPHQGDPETRKQETRWNGVGCPQKQGSSTNQGWQPTTQCWAYVHTHTYHTYTHIYIYFCLKYKIKHITLHEIQTYNSTIGFRISKHVNCTHFHFKTSPSPESSELHHEQHVFASGSFVILYCFQDLGTDSFSRTILTSPIAMSLGSWTAVRSCENEMETDGDSTI